MRTKPSRASSRFSAELSAKLGSMREQKGMTQGELAEEAGIDRKTINRIENGHFSPSMDTFFRICGALGTTPVKFLGK